MQRLWVSRFDWSKMEERINAAETALHARKHEFSMDHGGTPEENQAIEDVLHGLNILRKEAAAWQQSNCAPTGIRSRCRCIWKPGLVAGAGRRADALLPAHDS